MTTEGKIPINQLPYGAMNANLTDPERARSAIDERTITPFKIQEMMVRDFVSKKLVYNSPIPGMVVSHKETNISHPSNKAGKIATLLGLQPKNYIYKVLLFEYDPRPWRTQCSGYDDEAFIQTLPDVGLAPDLQPASIIHDALDGKANPIKNGTEVWVQYKDIFACSEPVIVKVGGVMNIEWPDEGGSAKNSFENGSGGPRGRRNSHNSAEKQKAIQDTKDLRQKIFEKEGYARKDRHGWKGDAILSQGDQLKLKKKYQAKIDKVASNLGVSRAALEKIFRKESGTFDPYAINRDTGATGLIQFMPSTAESLGTSTEALLKMGPEKQLDYVQKYFEQSGKVPEIKDDLDLYLIVFYPRAVGKPDDYIIGSERGQRYAQKVAQQNRGYRDPQMGNLVTKAAIRKKWNR
jgi:hypothetical protein